MCVATAVGLSEPLQKPPGSGSFENQPRKAWIIALSGWMDDQ